MNILVACEESQRVCIAFRNKGHNAYSCDILECSGGHPEWHICKDVTTILNGNVAFMTQDGKKHFINGPWDMVLAFPPCTHLAASGAAHFEKKRQSGVQEEAINFFCQFFDIKCDKVVIENPVNIISGKYCLKWFPELAKKYNLPHKPTQYIQPYEFGEPTKKKTGLWIKGLPKLKPTNIVEPKIIKYIDKNGKTKTDSEWHWYSGKGDGQKRSKTYLGIAEAMAEQWG